MNKYTFFYITERGEEKQEIVEATCFGRAYWAMIMAKKTHIVRVTANYTIETQGYKKEI